jgi:hypothetical protein
VPPHGSAAMSAQRQGRATTRPRPPRNSARTVRRTPGSRDTGRPPGCCEGAELRRCRCGGRARARGFKSGGAVGRRRLSQACVRRRLECARIDSFARARRRHAGPCCRGRGGPAAQRPLAAFCKDSQQRGMRRDVWDGGLVVQCNAPYATWMLPGRMAGVAADGVPLRLIVHCAGVWDSAFASAMSGLVTLNHSGVLV